MVYLWLKAAHVASVLVFISGLFAQTLGIASARRGDAGTAEAVAKWDRRVTLPAMLLAWTSGAAIAVQGGWFGSGWLSLKLGFVLALSGLHGVQSGRFRRLSHEPAASSKDRTTAVLVSLASSTTVIALLVVSKPF